MMVHRSVFLGGLAALGAAAAFPVRSAAAGNVLLAMRWYGGGVYELATLGPAWRWSLGVAGVLG